LRLRKIVVERVTVVKFRVDNRGSDGTGSFRIKVRTDTAELRVKKIRRHPGGKLLQSGLDFGGWRYLSQSCEDETRKKLSIICIKVVVKRK